MAGQLHGRIFEKHYKAVMCDSIPRGAWSIGDKYDVPAGYERSFGLPVSVKAAKRSSRGSATVCLADARRFMDYDGVFALAVGEWVQSAGWKVFARVHRFWVTPCLYRRLVGSLTYDEVAAVHDAIKGYAKGEHRACRAASRSMLSKLRAQPLRLNPKIDSDKQRRLQCSVPLRSLVEASDGLFWDGMPVHTVHEAGDGTPESLLLPFRVEGEPRKVGSSGR